MYGQELITIEQLPIISERLKMVSDEIDIKVRDVLSLDCNAEIVKEVKKIRADLNKEYKELEEKRKQVKNAIMLPYNEFEKVYKYCISDKYRMADEDLKNKINEVETEIKSDKINELTTYFNEYVLSKNIDFITYERANINVTMSTSMRVLKEQVKVFIDKIADDVTLIEKQENKEEILVEYKKSLNCLSAINTVEERLKSIEVEKQKSLETSEKKRNEEVLIKNIENVLQESLYVEPKIEPKKEINLDDEVMILSFKVTAKKYKLRELKKFLDDGGYIYE